MRKIIILLSLLGVCLTFSSCIGGMIIIGRFWLKAKEEPYNESYFICIDGALAATDSISIDFTSGRIPRIIYKNDISYYNDSTYSFSAKDTMLRIDISKKYDGKWNNYLFFDDAICADTIRLYKNDTLIEIWDKGTINTYHNIYKYDEWRVQAIRGCTHSSNNYFFSIKPEDIEKWQNGE